MRGWSGQWEGVNTWRLWLRNLRIEVRVWIRLKTGILNRKNKNKSAPNCIALQLQNTRAKEKILKTFGPRTTHLPRPFEANFSRTAEARRQCGIIILKELKESTCQPQALSYRLLFRKQQLNIVWRWRKWNFKRKIIFGDKFSKNTQQKQPMAERLPRECLFVKTSPAAKKPSLQWSDRGWDGWMASPTQWTWVWANFRRPWRAGEPGVLQSVGSQRVRHDLATEH